MDEICRPARLGPTLDGTWVSRGLIHLRRRRDEARRGAETPLCVSTADLVERTVRVRPSILQLARIVGQRQLVRPIVLASPRLARYNYMEGHHIHSGMHRICISKPSKDQSRDILASSCLFSQDPPILDTAARDTVQI